MQTPRVSQKTPFVRVGATNRDKSYLLSRAQKQPGQMVWNKGLFCNSATSQDAIITFLLGYICNFLTSFNFRVQTLEVYLFLERGSN